MLSLSPQLLVEATIVVGLIGALSLKLKLLDAKGVAASLPVGYAVYIFGGREYFTMLLTFYVISLLATVFRVRRIGVNVMDKEWVRSWKNVAANGVVAAAAAMLSATSPGSCATPYLAAYVGAVGTSFADTLATELGLLYPKPPRLITSMKPVPRGTPGAVSPYGYAASTLALTILASLLTLYGKQSLTPTLYAAGLIGVTIDSLMGATVQARYRCPTCGRETENPIHCGRKAEKIAGLTPINTHAVNLISTLIGAITAAIIAATTP